MILFVSLPLAAFLLIFFLLLKKSGLSIRAVFLWSAMLWALAAVIMIEILSLFHGLTRGLVAGGWGLVILGLGAGLKIFSDVPRKIKFGIFKDLSKIEIFLLGTTALVVLLTGLTAIAAAPNNWDSMTYHLPRVMHWVQNQSVAHYPTHILRQLYQPPGAEFLILHFQALAGNDRFVNLVQWFSLAGSIIAASLIAAELGASRFGQILTGFVVAVLPMGILQSSSTQNDLVAGFWLAVFVYFLIRLFKDPMPGPERWAAGCSLGLALLTKGTSYIFALPWLAGYFCHAFFKRKKTFFKDLGAVVLCCIVINAGHYVRNVQTFGSPLTSGSERYTNTGDFAAALIANPVRNVALHLATPGKDFNRALKEAVSQFHAVFSKNTEATTWGEFDIPASSTNEDIAGDPVHALAGLGVVVLVFISRKRDRPLKAYLLLTASAFLLFCLVFKWQLFHSRLHLPLFILFAPVLGVIISRIRKEALVWPVIFIFFFAALPALLSNERRPILGRKNIFNTAREEQYFSYRKFMLMPYVLTAKYVAARGWQDVGLVLGGDDWEYPLWVFLKATTPDVRIQHLDVKNVSHGLMPAGAKRPEAFISQLEGQPDTVVIDESIYRKRQRIAFIDIYEHIRP